MTKIGSKFKALPKWLKTILKAIAKFIGFIMLWIIISNVLMFLNPPERFAPKDSFRICVIEDGNPKMVFLKDAHQLTLCQLEYENILFYGYQLMNLRQIDNHNEEYITEWEMMVWEDSPVNPIYRYQIKNDKVKALWQAYGGLSYAIWWVLALIVTSILWKVTKNMSKNKLAENSEKPL